MTATVRFIGGFIIAAALSLSAAAHAQEADEATLTAARRLVVSAQVEQTFLRMTDQLIPLMLAPLARQRGLSAEQQQVIVDVVSEEMRRDPAPLIDMIARLYAQRLSAEELHAIADFYESPAGQRLLEVTLRMQGELAGVGEIWGREILAPRVQRRMEELLADELGPT